MSDDDLREQVARVLEEHQPRDDFAGNGYTEPREHWIDCSCGAHIWAWQQYYQETDEHPDDATRAHQAHALMPLIREAHAEAWDQGWDASVDAANKCVIAGGDPCGDCAICRPPNPYTERTDR